MQELREGVLGRLRRGEAAGALVREAELATEIARLERELAEVQQRIPFWQRLMFFVDSGDEQREDALQAQLAAAVEERAVQRTALERELDQVGKEWPAFGLAVRLERLAEEAREGLRTQSLLKAGSRRRLQATLEAVAAEVRAAWTPDLDEEALLLALSDEERCRARASESEGAPAPHPRTGWAPLSPRQLERLLARSLAGGPWFETRRHAAALEGRRQVLAAELAEARAAVPLLEKVNVFSASPEEARRDDLQKELAQVEDELRGARGRERAELHGAFAVFPPLLVHQRLVELVGLLSALESGTETVLTPAGKRLEQKVIVPRPLLVAALGEVRAGFRSAFPGVPWPSEAARELAGRELPAPPPTEAWLAPAWRALDEGPARAARADALEHAGLAAHLQRAREAAAGRVSLVDRLVFWSDTADEARARALGEMIAWHRKVARGRWERLLALGAEAGQQVVAIRLRDLALQLAEAVGEIHTDSGSSSSPRSCSVYGREAALRLVSRLQEELGAAYGLSGDRESILAAVAACDPPEGPQPPAGPFTPLRQEQVVPLLAGRLRGTGYASEHAALRALLREKQAAQFERTRAGELISWWDRINVFSSTPAEKREQEAGAELTRLGTDLTRRMQAVDRLFDQALAAYPPGRPFFALGGVRDAVGSIRGVCRSYSHSTGSGKNRRTETRYRCELLGLSAARGAVEAWCGLLVRTFGRLPGKHELLVLWEQARA